jgi:hypothetical protein
MLCIATCEMLMRYDNFALTKWVHVQRGQVCFTSICGQVQPLDVGLCTGCTLAISGALSIGAATFCTCPLQFGQVVVYSDMHGSDHVMPRPTALICVKRWPVSGIVAMAACNQRGAAPDTVRIHMCSLV